MENNEKSVVSLPPLTDRPKESDSQNPDNNESRALVHYKMNETVHKLPRPQTLRPYIDTKTAVIDSWPSHASTQNYNTLTQLTRSKSLQLIRAEALGKPNLIPQPKLLENLDKYLREELAYIDGSDGEESEISLEVYRKTFDHLIKKLKTYKHLLSRIKIQYEMAIDDLESQINSLKPLKETVLATAEVYEQKILAFNEQVKPDIKAIREENAELEEKMEVIRQRLLQIEGEKEETEDQLKKAYQLFRNEYDAQKLLTAEFKEMHVNFSKSEFRSHSSKPQDTQEDMTTLKIALSQSNEDADAIQATLNEMIAKYADVVPRRHYEQLEQKYVDMKGNDETLTNDLNTLKAEHDALQEVNQQITLDLSNYKIQSQKKKKALPKGPWVKSCQYVNPTRNYFEGISSDNMCETLLGILRDMDKNGAKILQKESPFFIGKGFGEEIPKFLKYEGKVYNRQFNKRECSLIIRDIWNKRLITYKKGTTFSDFVDSYLTQKFPLPIMKIEWAYNLWDGCQRFSASNKNIEFFWLCINNLTDENIYHYQLSVITDLMAKCHDALQSGNMMKRAKFQEILQNFLNPENPILTTSLVTAAFEEQDAKEQININELFTEDEEGEAGPFITDIRNWMKSLRTEFFELVSKELDEDSKVSIQTMDLAIRQTDPTLKTTAVKEILCWCFKTTAIHLLQAKPLPAEEVLSRLSKANIRFSRIKTRF